MSRLTIALLATRQAVSAAGFTTRVLAVVIAGHAERIAAAPIELISRRHAVR